MKLLTPVTSNMIISYIYYIEIHFNIQQTEWKTTLNIVKCTPIS